MYVALRHSKANQGIQAFMGVTAHLLCLALNDLLDISEGNHVKPQHL